MFILKELAKQYISIYVFYYKCDSERYFCYIPETIIEYAYHP